MRLLFEWIKSDENTVFNDFGINFTDDYDISYDSERRVVNIKKKESKIPRNFYTVDGSNVVSQVTCILGKNGAGKTSLLKHLYKTDSMERHSEFNEQYPQWSTVQVYEFDDGLRIYHNQKGLTFKCIENLNVEVIFGDVGINTTKLFISNDNNVALNHNGEDENKYQDKAAFTPYDMRIVQFTFFNRIAKFDNSSFLWRNSYYSFFNEYLRDHANANHLQHIAYALFLRKLNKDGKREEFEYLKNAEVWLPRIGNTDSFITPFGRCWTLLNRIKAENIINKKLENRQIDKYAKESGARNIDYELLYICAVYNFAVGKLDKENESIYNNLKINLTTEILLALIDLGINICELDSYVVADLLDLMERCIENQKVQNRKTEYDYSDEDCSIKEKELQYFRKAYRSIKELKHKVPIVLRDKKFLLDDNPQFLEFIDKEIADENYFIFKYMWVKCLMSSGERAYLNIFSNLNLTSYLRKLSNIGIKGINKNVLLILDEPDLSCHPEWQRKMLYRIITTLESLYKEHSFHIILSTHSPLFLSDIPKESTVLLNRNENGAYAIEKKNTQSFGANIFDLYNDSFFLDSFMGEFAQNKIENIIKKIYKWYKSKKPEISHDEIKITENEVELIGEPLIKNKLKSMLGSIKDRSDL